MKYFLNEKGLASCYTESDDLFRQYYTGSDFKNIDNALDTFHKICCADIIFRDPATETNLIMLDGQDMLSAITWMLYEAQMNRKYGRRVVICGIRLEEETILKIEYNTILEATFTTLYRHMTIDGILSDI